MNHRIAPGGHTGWHSHPGPVFVMVTAGTLTKYEADDPDLTPQVYPKGTGFVEYPGVVHIGTPEIEFGVGIREAADVLIGRLGASPTIRLQVGVTGGAVSIIDAGQGRPTAVFAMTTGSPRRDRRGVLLLLTLVPLALAVAPSIRPMSLNRFCRLSRSRLAIGKATKMPMRWFNMR